MTNDKSATPAYDDSMPILATRGLVAGSSPDPSDKNPHDVAPNTTLIGTDRVKKSITTEPRKQTYVQGFDDTDAPAPSFGSKPTKVMQTTPPRPAHERGGPSPAVSVRRQSSQTYQTISDNDDTGFEQTNPRLAPVIEGFVSRQANPDDTASTVEPQTMTTAPSLQELVEADILAQTPVRERPLPPSTPATALPEEPSETAPRIISLDPVERQRRRDALRNGTTYTPPRGNARGGDATASRERQRRESNDDLQELFTAMPQRSTAREPRPVNMDTQSNRRGVAAVPTTGSTNSDTSRAKDPFTSKRESRQMVIKHAVLGGCALFVVVLGVLVWQITSLSQQLSEARDQLENLPATEALATVMAEHEAEAQELQERIDWLETQLFGPPVTYEDNGYYLVQSDPDTVVAILPWETGYTIETTHTVESGQNIGGIAQLVLGSTGYVNAIMEANGITNPGSLQIGQVLTIPSVPIAEHTPAGVMP